MKKFIAFIFAALFAAVSYGGTETVDGIAWTYTIYNGEATIGTGGYSAAISNSTSGALIIPTTLGGCPVTTIGSYAFSHCSSLTSITIPDSVTTIGEWAFYYCSSLTSITIPNSVTTIGEGAFYNCSSLTSVTIGNSVTTIGYYAFADCSSLTSITIPNSVTEIDRHAFEGCSSLMSVTIPGHFQVKEIFPEAYTTISTVKIADGATSICYLAFYCCSSLTSVTIPDSVTEIGSLAFYQCSSLTSVTIPNSVTTIGSGAFEDCSSLTSITIPNSVTEIGGAVFGYCSSLKTIYVDDGDESRVRELLQVSWVNFVEGGLPDGWPYKEIANGVEFTFSILNREAVIEVEDCSAAIPTSTSGALVIPSTLGGCPVRAIGGGAFGGCSSLVSVTIPDSVTTIGEYAFSSCSSLTSVTIGNGVTMIRDYAFSWCDLLASITIPDSVTSIGEYAFEHCSSLESMLVPASVTAIGQEAFRECEKLNVTFECDCPENYLDTGIFDIASVTSKGKGYPTVDEVLPLFRDYVWIYGEGTRIYDGVANRCITHVFGGAVCYNIADQEHSWGLPRWINIVGWSAYGNQNGEFTSDEVTWYGDSFEITTERWVESIALRSRLFNGEIIVDYWTGWAEFSLSESELYHLDDCICVENFSSYYSNNGCAWLYPYGVNVYPVCTYQNKTYFKLPPVEEIGGAGVYEHFTLEYIDNDRNYVQVQIAPICESYVVEFDIGGIVNNGLLRQRVSREIMDPRNSEWYSIAICDERDTCYETTRDWNGYSALTHVHGAEWANSDTIVCSGWILRSGSAYTQDGTAISIDEFVDTVDGLYVTADCKFEAVCNYKQYSITYEDIPAFVYGYELPTSYTYGVECVLPKIENPGADFDYQFGASYFRFEGWTINGEKVESIPIGTIGDVIVRFNGKEIIDLGAEGADSPEEMEPGRYYKVFSYDRSVAWNGAPSTPKVAVTIDCGSGSLGLVEGRDYTVEYVDNDKVGTANVIVRGKGDYIGTYTGSFLITKGAIVAEDTRKDIFAWSPSSAVFAYDGTEKSISTIIAEDVDEINVEVTGTTSAVNAGVYTAKAKGTIKRFASDDYYNYTYMTTVDSTKTLSITARDLSDFSAALSQDVFFYDGAAKYPSVRITDEGLGVELKNGKDYNVSYLNNAQIGEASLTITGCGNYKGIITRQFTILDRLENLPKISITPESKVVNGRATITMTYFGIAGYETEVRYTTDGTEPTKDSSKYEKRFAYVVSADTTIKAAAFLRGVRVSEVASVRYLPSVNAAIVQTGEGCGPVEVQTSGAAPWVLDVEELGEDGTPSMKSGKIGNNGASIMTATFECDGVFEFWWKTSCEYDDLEEFFCDHVECWLDDEVYTQADGETPWTKVVVSVTTKGSHTITWKYVKDDADDVEDPSEDCAWVDGVKFSFAAYVDFAADEEIVGTLPERIVSSAGYEIELPEPGEVTYEKHAFAGWKYNGKVYQPGELLLVDRQEMTVKPTWTEVLEVAYNLNGGEGSAPEKQYAVLGSSVKLNDIGAANMAKHSFGGWSLGEDKYAAGDEFTPAEDVTFVAIWVPKTLAAPVIDVIDEHDDPSTIVTISHENATIYYTIDGTEPSETNGTRYEAPFEVRGSATIKAIAIKDDYFDSEVVETSVVSTYTPTSVGFDGGEGVIGTMPTTIESALRREIVLPEIGEARLPKHTFGGWSDGVAVYQPGETYAIVGEVSFSAVWTPKRLSAPVITVVDVYDGEKTTVEIATDDAEAEIRYTIDGSEPSAENGWLYESAFTVEGTTTIKAIVVRDDWFDSEIVEKTTIRSWGTINACVDNDTLVFTTGGDANWLGTSEEAYLGDTAVCSGAIPHNQSSWLETKVEGPGTLTYAIKVESEYFEKRGYITIYDGVTNIVDSVEQELIGGNVGWTIKTVKIDGEGEHVIRWVYAKDEMDEEWCGRDRAWIDAIVWTPTSMCPPEIESANEEVRTAFNAWVAHYGIKNPSEANVNAFILGLAPTATDEEIMQKVEAELENLDLSKLAEGDLSAAVEAIQAKYPNAKVALEEVTTIETNAHLYKLVIDLK